MKNAKELWVCFLTDLKPYDIVLGKLAASSVSAMFAMLTLFPIKALSLLMGGVTFGDFLRQSLMLITTLYFGMSLSLLLSAVFREAQHSMIFSLMGIIFFAGIVPAVAGMADAFHIVDFFDNHFNYFSPLFTLISGLKELNSSSSNLRPFALSVIFQLASGTIFIILSGIILPRNWRLDSLPAAVKLPHPFSPSSKIKAHRPIPHNSPASWLADRLAGKKRIEKGVLLCLFFCWLGFHLVCYLDQFRNLSIFVAMLGSYLFHVVCKCVIAIDSTRRFSADRNSGALELLLTTPLPADEIVHSQSSSLLRTSFPAVLLATTTNILSVIQVFRHFFLNNNRHDQQIFCTVFMLGVILLVVDSWTIIWTGMYQSIICRKQQWAVIRIMLFVTGLPLLLTFIFPFFTRQITAATRESIIIAAMLGYIVMSLMAGIHARRKLLGNFRQLVTEK